MKKNNGFEWEWEIPVLTKFLRAMKLTAFLLFISSFAVFANKSYSQSTTLNLNMENATVKEVLSKIEDLSGYNFMYSEKVINVHRIVSISAVNKSVDTVLKSLFEGTGVNFKKMNRIILLSKSQDKDINQSSQQEITISGKVTDSSGASLPGVTVVIKGTSKGTITDVDGNYTLLNVPSSATLVFSFVGMRAEEIPVADKTSINVSLTEESIGIDEVVAIGYGTQIKRNVTGSISKVDLEATENLPNTNFSQALRGRVAGVQFTEDGRPGQSGSLLIRGPRSLSAGNTPLIILDGAFFNGSYNDINPNDIESIEVLKDASSAAIYGSRAANGVILITTKVGASDKTRININSFYGLSEWSIKPKLLSPERYRQRAIDARKQNGFEVDPSNVNSYLTLSEAENYRNGKVVDPLEMISQQGKVFSANLSISGKNKNTTYYTSAEIMDEKGLLQDDDLKRVSVRMNLENKISDWLTIGTNSMYSKNDYSGVSPNPNYIFRQSPYGTWNREDGTPMQYTVPEDEGVSVNPMWSPYYQDNMYIRDNLFCNFYTVIDIPKIKGLTFRLNYSYNERSIENFVATKQDNNLSANMTSASKNHWKSKDWVLENILKYKFNIDNIHDFDITLLYGSDKKTQDRTVAESQQLITDILGWNNLELGATQLNSSYAEEVSGVSTMARLNYQLKHKYLLTLTARRDGSSVFASNNKYAIFPSAALGWIISDESFMEKSSFIDFLKLRLSYGATGNQAISPYQSLSLASTTQYVFGDGGETEIGVYPSNISNKDLKWETTYSTNAAIDFNLFKGRIVGTAEVYSMDTKNLLVERALPVMVGYNSTMTNLGLVRNKGYELTLNTVNIKKDKFEWSTDFVLSYNDNKIVHLYGEDLDGDGKEDDDVGNRWFIGQPIDVIYDFVFDGIYQVGDELPSGEYPGFERYKDLNNDGISDDANNDRAVIGQSGQPKYRWGINNNFKYGSFQFSFFINAMQSWIGSLQTFYDSNTNPLRPGNMYDVGWWTPENKSNTRPGLLEYNTIQTIDRSFIRIQDVSLTYNIPQNILRRRGIERVSVYLSGKNLVTFTDWLGTNPEVNTRYPLARTYSLGFKMEF